ncbi:MAG: DUF1499 domain-containing protein [Paracoccaceae bacterium]
MKLAKWLLIGVVFLAGWVRLAPSSPEDWHIDPDAVDAPGMRGHLAEATSGDDAQVVLQKLNAIALATPRTRLLAGSVQAGRITYITRSFVWGFPDYTTVTAENLREGSRLTLYARLRFGIGDRGVNRARIKSWLQRMDAINQ